MLIKPDINQEVIKSMGEDEMPKVISELQSEATGTFTWDAGTLGCYITH